MPDIRQAVLAELQRRGWSVVELSRRVEGVSYRHVYGWLRRDRGIGLSKLEPILAALGLEIRRRRRKRRAR